MSATAPIIFLIAFFILPIVVAIKICGWQVVAGFILPVLIIPSLAFTCFALYDSIALHKNFDTEGVIAMGALFGFTGIPIYFFIVIPIYYGLKLVSIPLHFSFPFAVSLIMLVVFYSISAQGMDYKIALVIVACSLIHSAFILWLIAKLNALFPRKPAQAGSA